LMCWLAYLIKKQSRSRWMEDVAICQEKKSRSKRGETDLGAVGMREQQATMKGLSRDIK
jgi:hypothetical protein